MGRASVNTGTSGRFTLDVYETFYSVEGNYSDVTWNLFLEEATSAGSAWNNNGTSATVGHHNVEQWWAGTFNYDWRAGGLQYTQIAGGVNRVYHNPDGTGQVTVGANMGYSGSQSAGGPTQITNTISLTTLTALPRTPTTPNAVRISDNQVDLNWTQDSYGNHAANFNQVHKSVNDGAFQEVVSFSATNAANIGGVGPNQKLSFKVTAQNSAGYSGFSGASAPVFTTPAAPTNASAVKGASLDITVAFANNVAYAEHNHEVLHGVVVNGVTQWDASGVLLGSGVTSYVHQNPNASQVHAYAVRAVAAGLQSAWAFTSAVQLLVAPNKPSTTPLPAVADKAQPLIFSWQHNPIDTSAQTAYEVAVSTSGGAGWDFTGRVYSSANQVVIAANSYPANTTLTLTVRTWGAATTGGEDNTGMSGWSDFKTLTLKSVPTVSVVSPVNGSTLNDSSLRVNLAFAQTEGASFVRAQVQLRVDGNVLEATESSTTQGIPLRTVLQNGVTYNVIARVQDSNGLWSQWNYSNFSVAYLSPPPAEVTVTYLPNTGWGQINLNIPAPGAEQSAASVVTILRSINGVEEVIVEGYPVSGSLTFMDTTPTIHGTNLYRVVTLSALGAQINVYATLVTEECRRAYLSKGAGYADVVVFGANLSVSESLSVASDTIQASGRVKPIGLYGVESSVQLKVQSFLFEGFGSDIDAVRAILLVPGKACYRDASGRRVFGSVKGSIAYKKTTRGDLSFTLTETS